MYRGIIIKSQSLNNLPLYTSCRDQVVSHWVWHQGTQQALLEELVDYVPEALEIPWHLSGIPPTRNHELFEIP